MCFMKMDSALSAAASALRAAASAFCAAASAALALEVHCCSIACALSIAVAHISVHFFASLEHAQPETMVKAKATTHRIANILFITLSSSIENNLTSINNLASFKLVSQTILL